MNNASWDFGPPGVGTGGDAELNDDDSSERRQFEQQQQQEEADAEGTLPLQGLAGSTASSSASPPTRGAFLRGADDAGHFLATGPSFSSLATNGSTIVPSVPALSMSPPLVSAKTSTRPSTSRRSISSSGRAPEGGGLMGGRSIASSNNSDDDQRHHQHGVGEEYTAPLEGQDISNEDERQAVRVVHQVARQIPRTNSYYRRAGMTSRLDDYHYLANAPSFSSASTMATTASRATSVVSSRMSLMSLEGGGGGGGGSDLVHPNAPSGIPTNTSTSRSTGSNGNIFLRQDDPDYQNLLTSIATSSVVINLEGRQAIANDRCGHPRQQQQQQHHRQQSRLQGVSPSSSSGRLGLNRRSSSALGGSSSSSLVRRPASSSALRRSRSISAGSILRRGRYSSGFLGSIREHEGDHHADGREDTNRQNASFGRSGRRNSTNSLQFTAPTIHQLVSDFQPNEMHGVIPTNIVINASAASSGASAVDMPMPPTGTSMPSSASKAPVTEAKMECISDIIATSMSSPSPIFSPGRSLCRARSSGSLSSLSSMGSRHSNRL